MDFGLADCPPSVVVEGDSTPDGCVGLPSKFWVSVTLNFGIAASDMAEQVPCVHRDRDWVNQVRPYMRVG